MTTEGKTRSTMTEDPAMNFVRGVFRGLVAPIPILMRYESGVV